VLSKVIRLKSLDLKEKELHSNLGVLIHFYTKVSV
jgi:hypothetical protein